MHYDLKKWMKEKGFKQSEIIFLPNPTRGNGLMMICPDGTICDVESCCEKVDKEGKVIG